MGVGGKGGGADAVVARLLDFISGRFGVLQVDLCRQDLILRVGCIRAQDEFAELGGIAKIAVNVWLSADVFLLKMAVVSRHQHDMVDFQLTSTASGEGQTPIRSSSLYSNITRLTKTSWSGGGEALLRVVRI